MKKRGLIKGIALTTVAAIPMLSTTVAFAGTSFDAQYQANASQEASLLQTAQASTVTSPEISGLSSTVQNINTQISSLYNVEQSLASAKTNISQINPQNLSEQIRTLEKRRQELLKQSQTEWGYVTKFNHRHDRNGREQYSKAMNQWKAISSQLASVNNQLTHLVNEKNLWSNAAPYNGGLASLQNAILKLQAAAIQYTKEWIAIEQNGGSTTTSISAPTGLTVSNITSNGWTVSWIGVPGASSYDVYLNGTEVASNVMGTSYTFNNENPGTSYTITVTAVDSSNNQSAQSNPVTVTTPTVNSIHAPTGLTISNVTSSGWTLSWTAVNGASSYNIYVNGKEVVSNVIGTSYTFTGQNPSTNYTVTVTAVDSSNNESAQSAAATVTTLS